MKYTSFWDEEYLKVIPADKLFDSRIEAYQVALSELDSEIEKWIPEAKAALERNELYRGGGVLKLAELMRKKSFCEGRLAAEKHYQNA